jgi:hypothetical protein
MIQKYKITASLPDEEPSQLFGILSVIVPLTDDGFDTDNIVNELMEAATTGFVRDCIWKSEEVHDRINVDKKIENAWKRQSCFIICNLMLPLKGQI